MKTREQIDSETALSDQIAFRLGRICMVWSAIDRQLDPILAHLIDRPINVARALAGRTDGVGERCDAIQRLLRMDAPSPDYRDWAIDLITRVAKELAERRNRIVHDYWRVDGDIVLRALRKPVRDGTALRFDVSHAESPDKLERFEYLLITMLAMLTHVEHDMIAWRKRGRNFGPMPEYDEMRDVGTRFSFPTDEDRADLIRLSSGFVREPGSPKPKARVASQ